MACPQPHSTADAAPPDRAEVRWVSWYYKMNSGAVFRKVYVTLQRVGRTAIASTGGRGAVCLPQGGARRVVVLACPRLSEARVLLEASDLVANVLGR